MWQFFCVIGKFFELPYNTKTLRGDRTAAEVGLCRVCDPPQAENPAWQDSLFLFGKYRFVGDSLRDNICICLIRHLRVTRGGAFSQFWAAL